MVLLCRWSKVEKDTPDLGKSLANCSSLKLDLYDKKKQPTNKLKIKILYETSILYLIRHALVILTVGLHL